MSYHLTDQERADIDGMTCPDCGNLLTDTGPRCRECAGPMTPRPAA